MDLVQISVFVAPGEKRKIEVLAGKMQRSVSSYCRIKLLAAIDKVIEKDG